MSNHHNRGKGPKQPKQPPKVVPAPSTENAHSSHQQANIQPLANALPSVKPFVSPFAESGVLKTASFIFMLLAVIAVIWQVLHLGPPTDVGVVDGDSGRTDIRSAFGCLLFLCAVFIIHLLRVYSSMQMIEEDPDFVKTDILCLYPLRIARCFEYFTRVAIIISTMYVLEHTLNANTFNFSSLNGIGIMAHCALLVYGFLLLWDVIMIIFSFRHAKQSAQVVSSSLPSKTLWCKTFFSASVSEARRPFLYADILGFIVWFLLWVRYDRAVTSKQSIGECVCYCLIGGGALLICLGYDMIRDKKFKKYWKHLLALAGKPYWKPTKEKA